MCGAPEVDRSAQEQAEADAKRARAEEKAREKEIRKGTRHINNIFDGGRYRVGTETAQERVERPTIERIIQEAEPTQVVGGRNEGASVPGSRIIRFKVGDQEFDSRDEARDFRRSLPRTRDVQKDVFAVSEGVQPFLDQRRGALADFFLPQLDEQYDDAGEDLLAAHARAGTLHSSSYVENASDLERQFALAGAKVQSDIEADVARTAQRFDQERSALIAELRANADRSAATQGAQRVIQNIQAEPPDFNPLPSLFEGVTASIGSAAQNFRATDALRRTQSGPSASVGRIIGG